MVSKQDKELLLAAKVLRKRMPNKAPYRLFKISMKYSMLSLYTSSTYDNYEWNSSSYLALSRMMDVMSTLLMVGADHE